MHCLVETREAGATLRRPQNPSTVGGSHRIVTGETATNSRANAICLIWRRKQLLGVRGLATKAGAPSPIFISTPQHKGHPHPGLSRSTKGTFSAGFFTGKSPANRVRGATASGDPGLPYGSIPRVSSPRGSGLPPLRPSAFSGALAQAFQPAGSRNFPVP